MFKTLECAVSNTIPELENVIAGFRQDGSVQLRLVVALSSALHGQSYGTEVGGVELLCIGLLVLFRGASNGSASSSLQSDPSLSSETASIFQVRFRVCFPACRGLIFLTEFFLVLTPSDVGKSSACTVGETLVIDVLTEGPAHFQSGK